MNNDNLGMLDILNILSFAIGLMNYQENLTQSDKQELMGEVNRTNDNAIRLIEEHLADQDDKLNDILMRLEELK